MSKATNKAALKGYGSNIRVVKARLAFAFFKFVAGGWPILCEAQGGAV